MDKGLKRPVKYPYHTQKKEKFWILSYIEIEELNQYLYRKIQ